MTFEHKEDIGFEGFCIDIWSFVSKFIPYLSQDGSSKTVLSLSKIEEKKFCISLVPLKFWSKSFSYVIYWSKSRDYW